MQRRTPDTVRRTASNRRVAPGGILVVEDEYLVAVQVQQALGDAGFNVVGIAATGEEALAIAARENPSLAVVDVSLDGEMDGIEVALAMFRNHGVRSILATAHYDHETWSRAEAASSLGWLPKPYSMNTLLLKVESALRAT